METTKNVQGNSMYNFAVRWLFSTNHKCGALIFSVNGIRIYCIHINSLYEKTVIIKSLDAHLKYSKKMKRSFEILSFMSLGKQTLIMISSVGEAGNKIVNLGRIQWCHSSNLLCGANGLFLELNYCNFARYSTALSQDLGETCIRHIGQLKYGYEGGHAFLGVRLGMYGKLRSLRDSNRNVVLPLNTKRDFSSGKSYNFKGLNRYKNKFNNLVEVIADVDFLQSAYQYIKPNPRIIARGSDFKTLDGLNEKWWVETSKRLLDGSYAFKPVRRVMIPKHNKPGLRPLTLSNPRDKIVQQAIKMVLEQIYDDKFLDSSHGFRTSRGCHTALEMIRMNWTNISWFLEFDVEKCYDKIDRHRLVNIFKEDIDDQRFIDLISKLFNAGVVTWKEGLSPNFLERVSQDSLLSPILFNIYLLKLDLEVARIIEEYQKGKIRRVNLDVHNKKRRVYRRKKFIMLSTERQAAIMSKHKADRRKLEVTMTDWKAPNFVRVKYVRYIDDFLLGIAGSKKLVKKIRYRIITFVKSNLKLNLTGGDITHIVAGKVKFLGMCLQAVPHSKFPRRFGKTLEKKKRVKNRIKLQKSVKEEKPFKIIRTVLKKVLKETSGIKLDSSEINKTIEALKKWVSHDSEFSKEFAKVYRKFIFAVSKTIIFLPEKLRKELEVLNREIDEWKKDLNSLDDDPKKRYKELVGSYETLPLQIDAPLENIRDKLRKRKIISKSNKPKAIHRLYHVPDSQIVKWYGAVSKGLLNYFCCCQNFDKVKDYVDYMVRWSAIYTLAGKHKSSSRKIIAEHTKDLIIKDEQNFVLAKFISSTEIKSIKKQFRTNVSKDTTNKILNQI